MKRRILLLLILSTKIIYAQDTIVKQNSIYQQRLTPVKQHGQFFGFTPLSKKINKVNFAFGFGHVENKRIANQTINGLNLEVNPAPIVGTFAAFLLLMNLPDVIKNADFSSRGDGEGLRIENWKHTPNVKINGLNLSTGCFFTTANMNGLNISLANKFNDFNGLSVTVLGTMIDNQNGISIGIYNANNSLKGATVGLFNQSYELKGVHFGLINATKYNRGLQVGVFNRSYSKGFQIGVWNKNDKRSFPLINW